MQLKLDLLSNKIRREELMPGDHIYLWRRGYSYSHHGIYVGEGKVIHVVRGPGPLMFSAYETGKPSGDQVMCCTLDEFLSGGGHLRRYQYGVSLARYLIKRGGSCSLNPSDPPEVVLHRANFLLDQGFGDYHLLQNNCEDFATYCKTGWLKVDISTSSTNEQIKFLTAVIFAIIFTPYEILPSNFACLSLVLCAVYCIFRLKSNQGMEKVAVEHIFDVEETKRSWSQSIVDRIAFAVTTLKLWAWSPKNRLLYFLRIFNLHSISNDAIMRRLRNRRYWNPLRNLPRRYGENLVYMIWVLAYWYWSSENAIFICTRLIFLTEFLPLLITDEPERIKRMQDYMAPRVAVIGLWHWTPQNIIFRCFRFLFVYVTACETVSNDQILDWFFLVCITIQLAASFVGLDYKVLLCSLKAYKKYFNVIGVCP